MKMGEKSSLREKFQSTLSLPTNLQAEPTLPRRAVHEWKERLDFSTVVDAEVGSRDGPLRAGTHIAHVCTSLPRDSVSRLNT